jgi:tetratricopeptide (TPR) repeat protein
MASPEQGGRKPVTVYHFPKVTAKPAASTRSRRTQSITELKPVSVDDDVTDPSSTVAEVRKREKSRRTKTLEVMPEAHVGHVGQAKRVKTPQDAADLAAFGHELFELGRFEEARQIFEKLVSSNTRDAFAHTMLGTIYLALNAHDRALALFQAALKIDPDDLAALVYRGEIRLNRGKIKSALEDLMRAVTLAPAADPFVERAKRLVRMGKGLLKRKK